MQNVGRYADILFRAICNYDKNMVYSQMGEEFTKYSKDVFMLHDMKTFLKKKTKSNIKAVAQN